MTNTPLFAHSLPDKGPDEWQDLWAHLENVAAHGATFASAMQSENWAWNAGLLHDIGKAAIGFQAYLRRSNGICEEEGGDDGVAKPNHSSAGAALARDEFGLLGTTLCYMIAGHHAGLANHSDSSLGSLEHRLVEGQENLKSLDQEILKPLISKLRFIERLPKFVNKSNFHFWTRMLFSCLVDADFLDTEKFMQADRAAQRAPKAELSGFKMQLDRHLDGLRCASPKVAKARADVLAACRKAAKRTPGIYSLTVPTGGGKTLASTAFAMDHALVHGKDRIVYVIPFTSIIEQTAATLGRIFGSHNVVEHHSNIAGDDDRNRLATENWDAPIVVTTNVQFFESLFADRPSRCRKLHNLQNSVVILDEAQLVPPHLLTPCVHALNELSENYGVTILLSTATQPALPGLNPCTEIIPDDMQLYQRLRRTDIKFPSSLHVRSDWDSLAQRLTGHKQVLCIVNTRKDCYTLHQKMPSDCIHLSATMCGQHRAQVIETIRSRLRENQPVQVISTQLVEAGVDIDFPVVYRALAGLDSIVQAAGRCNREGKSEKAKVHVFISPTNIPEGLLRKGEATTRELLHLPGFDPQAPEWHKSYFHLFYNKLNDSGSLLLKALIPSCSRTLDVAFREVGKSFRLIDDRVQRSVIVRYGSSIQWIDELRKAGPSRALMRRLQRYTVNIPHRIVERMCAQGRLEELSCGIIVQTLSSDYSATFGLDVFSEYLPIDDLIL